MKSSREAPAKRAAIYRPASAGWQKWGEDASGNKTLQGESPELSDLQPAASGMIAVPVRRAFSLSVWVPADDPAIFRDLVLTQLEMRGLAGRTREETSFAWQEIARCGCCLHLAGAGDMGRGRDARRQAAPFSIAGRAGARRFDGARGLDDAFSARGGKHDRVGVACCFLPRARRRD